MEIIFTVNHNNLITFSDLNSGQIFQMIPPLNIAAMKFQRE